MELKVVVLKTLQLLKEPLVRVCLFALRLHVLYGRFQADVELAHDVHNYRAGGPTHAHRAVDEHASFDGVFLLVDGPVELLNLKILRLVFANKHVGLVIFEVETQLLVAHR